MADRSARGHGRLKWAIIALLVVTLAAWLGRDRWLGPEVAQVTLTPTELIRTLVVSGRVETPQRVAIGSQVTATVAAVPVREGQAVQSGQILVQLEAAEARAALEQARAGVVAAEARLVQLRELALPAAQQGVRQAEVNQQNAQRQFERIERLRRDNFVGQAQLDDARRALDLADSQVRSARLQAASNAGQGADVRLAEAALAQARAAVQSAEARLAYTTVRAPVAGVLISRAVERGDVVQPGKVLMQLSPAGAARLVAQIDEKNLAVLAIGQVTTASADAFPAQRFPATLAYINPGVDAQRGAVQVKFDVPQPPAFLRQDMTVSIEVEVGRRPGALVVPDEALHVSADGKDAVFVVSDGRARERVVRTGVRQGGKVEIVEGLESGVTVTLGGKLRDGQPVRAQRR